MSTPADMIRDIPVRVSVELGRTTMPLSRAVGLPPGAVVELERGADEHVDLYVNNRQFASGVLVVTESNEWAVRIDKLFAPRSGAGS